MAELHVTERDLADRTGTSVRYWQELRRRGGGPPYVRLSSRCIRYPVAEVERWLAERTRTSTQSP